MNKLTKAEEEIMLILWDLGEATVRDVINKIKDNNLAYTTIASFIRILEKKEFIAHKSVGSTHIYYPLISQSEYARHSLSGLLNKYFDGSFTNLASFFATENNISLKDLQVMMEEVKEDLKEDKKSKKNAG
jgi:BlaI family transcriptional regulator, penicillinase repressor